MMKYTPDRALRIGTLMAGTILCGTLAAANPAQAQQAADEGAPKVDEIVVTAQFREQRLQDTPIAITAISGEALEQRGSTNLTDVAKSAPSVVLRPASASFGNSVTASIRGLGQIDFNPAYEPGVGLYIDDVYYPRLTGANFDLLDVARVEVLRGPQGTLTGRNSEGGAIKFVSRKPTGESDGYISATYGSRNRINLRGSADFKLSDTLFGRISGTFADQGGYVDVIDYGCANPASGVPTTSGGAKCKKYSEGDVGYQALRGILRYAPSDRLDVMISADYVKDKHHNPGSVLLYGSNSNPNVLTPNGLPLDNRFLCGKYCNYTTTGQPAASFVAGLIPPLQGLPLAATEGGNDSTFEGWGVTGNVELELTDAVKLTSISAYREWDSYFTVDSDLSPTSTGYGINSLDHWFVSQELRLNAELASNLKMTLGGYYSDEKTTYYTMQDIRYVAAGPLPIFPLQFIGNDPVRTKSKALYGTLAYEPVENLTLTAGLRYTKDSKSYTFYRYNFDGTTINPFLDPVGAQFGPGYVSPDGTIVALTGRTPRFSGDRFDYRVSVDYRFSPEVLVYGTVATGYKAGGVGPRPFNAQQAQPFGPETVTSYELGIKTDLFDRRVRLNVAGFFQDFKDAQLTLLSCPQFGGPGPCALPQNAGDAEMKGIEAELFATPVEGLQLDASLSYIDWKWKCVNPAVVGLPSGSCSSDPAVVSLIASTPRGLIKWKWSAGAQYEIPLGNMGSLTPRFDITHEGGLAGGDLAPVPGSPSDLFGSVPSFTVANARMTWRNADEDLDISFEVTNLFDNYYYTSTFDLTGAGAGAITASPARPREWAVSIKKKF
jgi:iron complex outermembrane receptor protein